MALHRTFNAKGASDFPPSLPCIVCGCELKNWGADENHPLGAVEFVARGQYGSAVFDPQDGSRAIVNICDKCLEAAIDRKVAEIIRPKGKP